MASKSAIVISNRELAQSMRRKEIGSSSGGDDGSSNDQWSDSIKRCAFVLVCLPLSVWYKLYKRCSDYAALLSFSPSLHRVHAVRIQNRLIDDSIWCGVEKRNESTLFFSHFFSVTLELSVSVHRPVFLSRPLFVNTPLTFKYLRNHKSKALLFTFLTFSLARTHNNHRNSRFFLRFVVSIERAYFHTTVNNDENKNRKERVATVKLIWRVSMMIIYVYERQILFFKTMNCIIMTLFLAGAIVVRTHTDHRMDFVQIACSLCAKVESWNCNSKTKLRRKNHTRKKETL